MMHLQFKPTDLYYVTKTLQGESSSPLLFYFFFYLIPYQVWIHFNAWPCSSTGYVGSGSNSAAGSTCSLRSTARGGTKEGFTAEAAGRCVTLRLRSSAWRRDGGWVWLVGVGDRDRDVNTSSSGRGHQCRFTVELLIGERGHTPSVCVFHWRTLPVCVVWRILRSAILLYVVDIALVFTFCQTW